MIDYTSQINLSRKLSKMKQELFKFVAGMAELGHLSGDRFGLLLIVGNFAHGKLLHYTQLGTNDCEGHAIMYNTKAFREMLESKKHADGAFILDSLSGQLLGNRVLYMDLKPDMQEERGARHYAAASASKDENVDFAITVSEEDGAVRLYVKGAVEEQQDIIKNESEAVEEDRG